MDRNLEQLSPDTVGVVLAKLQETLSEENSLLESGQPHDHQRFINSKNQILRDLIVWQRSLPKAFETQEIRDQLHGVRRLVDRNHALLRSHVDAMMELTSILAEVEIAEDADGTYSKFKN
jgi:flagellar biosynthesis/type III secretory pathway chaperone